MREESIRVLLVGLLLAGCGSGSNGGQVDAAPYYSPDTSVVGPPATPDAGCDEDAVGESYFILNCSPAGGGTPVSRQNPVPYQTCKL
jgi:hypothetical protein